MSLIPFRLSRARRFERCVQPHLTAMYRFAYRLTGQREDAEDLVQEVLVKLYPKARDLFEVDNLGPWLNRVLYRQFIDQTRRKAWSSERPLSEVISGEGAQEFVDSVLGGTGEGGVALDQERLQAAMAQALSVLTPDQRSLLLLHDVDGWRQEDIAEVLDVAVGTVKSRLHRCRAQLRQVLGETLEPYVTELRLKG